MIDLIRQQILPVFKNSIEDLDSRDRHLIADEDLFIERYIKFYRSDKEEDTIDKAVNAIIETLKWRQSMKVNDIDGQWLFAEAFTCPYFSQ